MKLVVSLLLSLISVSVLAQQSSRPPAPTPQQFQQARQKMLSMMEQTLPVMEQTRDCIQASSDTASLNRCMEIMLGFQRQMRERAGVPKGGPHGRVPEAKDLKLEWSRELQQKMVQDIGRSITNSKTVRDCLQRSDSNQAMQSCMEKNGLSRRR